MTGSNARQDELLRCPRCGANVEDPLAGHCDCCGSSLGLGGVNAKGERVPLSMSMGVGQETSRDSARPSTPAEGAFRASATGQRFASVRRHHLYGEWMQDAPSGIGHALGLASVAALGAAFVVMALGGFLHGKRHSDDGLVVPLVVIAGLGFVAYGIWKLVSFYQAPLLHRVACVADERQRVYRTKYGWRTRNYVTLEFEGGLRREFPVSGSRAAELMRGQSGVAITRDDVLLAFHRVGPA